MNDLISRKATYDTLTAYYHHKHFSQHIALKDALDKVPSIDPVKHGKWITMSDADGVYWSCSECGEDIPRVAHYNPQFDLFPRLEGIDRTNYCPACGARMNE